MSFSSESNCTENHSTTQLAENDSEDLFHDYYNEAGKLVNYAANNDHKSDMHLKNYEYLGCNISELNTDLKLPSITVSSSSSKKHVKSKVFVKFPLTKKGDEFVVPQPHPEQRKDRWDDSHVRMPCSSQSQFPVDDSNGGGPKILKNRWQLIENALSQKITNAYALEAQVLSYNRSGRWNLDGLKDLLEDQSDEEEGEEKGKNAFFDQILPEMCALALKLPFLITSPIPLLKRGTNQSLTFSQFQVASLLANSFFCTYPRRNASGKRTEYANFPIINFNRLFSPGEINQEKLNCVINYFRRVTKGSPPKSLITFTRRCISSSSLPRWNISTKRLLKLRISSEGTIEDDGKGMLQVRRNFSCTDFLTPSLTLSKI